MPESITFRAAFPSIMSAILVTGNREGMRIKLDIPESEMATAANLLLWRERVLVVTVEPESEPGRRKARKINI